MQFDIEIIKKLYEKSRDRPEGQPKLTIGCLYELLIRYQIDNDKICQNCRHYSQCFHILKKSSIIEIRGVWKARQRIPDIRLYEFSQQP